MARANQTPYNVIRVICGEANGTQTGTRGPQFNGYYFNIWEPGAAWEIGGENLPRSFGIGLWSLTASGAKNKLDRLPR
jgi:hypothetical protein